MRPRPTLSLVAQAHIRELRDRWHVEPTVEEILWLQELGQDVENPSRGERLDLIGTPVRAGDAWLWPMTIKAAVWWAEFGREWFAGDPTLYTYALAFALAHGRKAEVTVPRGFWPIRGTEARASLAEVTEEADGRRAVCWWALRCGATRKELEAAVDACLPPDPTAATKDNRGPRTPPDWQAVVHELATIGGEPAAYWTEGTSMTATARAYARARAIASARAGAGGVSTPSLYEDALRAIRAAMGAIIKAHAPPEAPPEAPPAPPAEEKA